MTKGADIILEELQNLGSAGAPAFEMGAQLIP